jgi:hypothetical protein
MNSLQFFFKNAWRWKFGLPEFEEEFHDANKYGSMPTIEELRKESYDDRFNFLMNNRMLMGRFRYGPRKTKKEHPAYITAAKRRIELYEESGNTELLVDAGNYLRMEFETPLHPNGHFKSIDDGEHSQ